MKIRINSLMLTNFKGIRQLVVQFKNVTDVFGDNATGKTTLFDAFLWLLFGKDSTGRTDFEIKTLDKKGKAYKKLDHEVVAELDVNGQVIILRRVYREKWETPRGSAQEQMNGHKQEFYWNDVPLKESEYMTKVAGIVDEKLFKLITNTGYFNSLKWQERREVLLKLAGKIEDVTVLDAIATLDNKTEIGILTNALNQGKTVEEFRKELNAKKKKLKDELVLMPSRISEANRALPAEVDYDEIETLIARIGVDIETIEGSLMDKTNALKDHQKSINELLRKRQEVSTRLLDAAHGIKDEVKQKGLKRQSKIREEESLLSSLNDSLVITRRQYSAADARRNAISIEQAELREKWEVVDKKELKFKDGEFCCPACKRDFPEAEIESRKEELTKNFRADKSKSLKEISDKGSAIGQELKDLDTKLENLKSTGETLKGEIAEVTSRIAELRTEHQRLSDNEVAECEKAIGNDVSCQAFRAEIVALSQQIDKPYSEEDNSALLQRKRELSSQLGGLQSELATKGQRKRQLDRIAELENQEQGMNQELASLQGVEFCIDQYTKTKMDILEQRINGLFGLVRFKMFEDQVNGGQSEACITLIDGVPYSDANTASKVQAGLDIINVLNRHFSVEAPVWVDNRESVVKLPFTNCQLINLHVSGPDKQLRVETAA